MKRKEMLRVGLALCAFVVVAVVPAVAADQDDLPMNIRANVARASGAGQGRAGMMQITIERWTTDDEAKPLLEAIKAGNQADIEKEMQSLKPVGKANIQGQMGLDLRVARVYQMDGGGLNIILGTDRPINAGEAARGGMSMDFNTSLIVLNIPASGAGDGYFAGAVELSMGESGKIETDTAGQGVTKLAEVEVKTKKKK